MLEATEQVRKSGGMNGGKRCPRCFDDIGIAPTLFLYFNRLECPHCELPLRYEESLKFVLIKLIVLLAVGGSLSLLIHDLPLNLQLLWLLVFAFLWVGVEALAGAFFRELGILRVRH